MPFYSMPKFKTACLLLILAVTGCERAEPIRWASSDFASELSDKELQAELNAIVRTHSGTAAQPRLVSHGKDDFDFELHLKHGQAVYMKRCVQCHGVNGDGNGPAAVYLYPRPRDYTKGIFKFTSTPYGNKPGREDLISTIRRGVTGTSMPRFNRISDKEVEAVVDYVMVLSQRGELEFQLAMEADASEELDPDFVPEFVEDVANRWLSAKLNYTSPLSPQPAFTPEVVDLGKKAFLSKGCSGCHGNDGRGHTPENFKRNDSWGHPTRAADLTSGMLRGGQEPIDVYRRILNGINGSPMPGFKSALQKEPDTIWHLVAFVLDVSNRRRFGEEFTAGLMKEYRTAANTEADAVGLRQWRVGFGLGTVPIMLVTGAGLTLASLQLRQRLMKAAAFCVLITGLLTIGRGIAFASNATAQKPEEACPFCEAAQEIHIEESQQR